MKIIPLEQGSESWLEYRREHIMASMAPVIMGVSPYQTRLELYNNIINKVEQKQNPAMRMGSEREKEAREWMEKQFDVKFSPCVVESDEFPWMAASLDGMSESGQTIIEIKWNNKESHAMALIGNVPVHHMTQLQHQMAVCNLFTVWYVSCHGDHKHCFLLHRDKDYIDKMVDAEIEFLDMIVQRIPPETTQKDINENPPTITSQGPDFDVMCAEYLRISEEISSLTETKKDIMDYLKSKIGKTGCTENYSLKKSIVKGSYDYALYFKANPLEVQRLFKKPDTESWRITKI